MSWARRLGAAFNGGPRLATALLALVGAAIATWAAARSVYVSHPFQAGVYAIVSLGLVALAIALLLSRRVAELIAALILLLSVPGAAGAEAELAAGVDPAKAEEVRSLGVDPRAALELNLAYFLAATAIAAWLLARLLLRRHSR